MGTFFEQIAGEAKAANPITYAAALHEAQLKVRGQSKWSSPYIGRRSCSSARRNKAWLAMFIA